MGNFEIVIIVVSLAWGILCLILLSKIWGMTDDVKVMKNIFLTSKLTDDEIKVGDTVFHIWANQFFVVTDVSPDEDSCVCKTIGYRPRSKTYRKSDLKVFKA